LRTNLCEDGPAYTRFGTPGRQNRLSTPAGDIGFCLAHNPSHLESVTPVIAGVTRAKQERKGARAAAVTSVPFRHLAQLTASTAAIPAQFSPHPDIVALAAGWRAWTSVAKASSIASASGPTSADGESDRGLEELAGNHAAATSSGCRQDRISHGTPARMCCGCARAR
jgi:2-oxoglutarate dehydrogenase complex dehydrogenase (E1) component-like enzyme